MNKALFRSQMAKRKETIEALAEKLGIHPTTLSHKVNGYTGFTQAEIQYFKTHWNLTANELDAIFFGEGKD